MSTIETNAQIANAIQTEGTYAVHASAEALNAALGLCRGCYQRAVVLGEEALSGATLRGKAAHTWGARYAESRRSLMRRLAAAGLGREVRGPRGRRVLVIG